MFFNLELDNQDIDVCFSHRHDKKLSTIDVQKLNQLKYLGEYNQIRTYNHLFCKGTPNHLALLAWIHSKCVCDMIKKQKHLGLPIDSKLDFNEDIDKKIK